MNGINRKNLFFLCMLYGIYPVLTSGPNLLQYKYLPFSVSFVYSCM